MPVFFQPFAGIEHGLMLGSLRDDVISLLAIHLRDAVNRQIVGFGRAAREDNLLRHGVNQLGYLSPGALHSLLSRPSERAIAAGRFARFLTEIWQHRFPPPRVCPRG